MPEREPRGSRRHSVPVTNAYTNTQKKAAQSIRYSKMLVRTEKKTKSKRDEQAHATLKRFGDRRVEPRWRIPRAVHVANAPRNRQAHDGNGGRPCKTQASTMNAGVTDEHREDRKLGSSDCNAVKRLTERSPLLRAKNASTVES